MKQNRPVTSSPAPMHRRLFVRMIDGTAFVQLMTISGIVTVLIVRAVLALTHYPQVGGGSLHIAHVLWGGLFMLVALVLALLFIGRAAQTWTAVLGGIGLGLFVDEIGKFVTATNDYFYRPAAAIIYVTFAALVLAMSLINRDRLTDGPERTANAANIATTGIVSGLSPKSRAEALRLLDDRNDEQSQAIRALLTSIPDHADSELFTSLIDPVRRFARSAARREWVVNLAIAMFVVYLAISTAIYSDKALVLLSGGHNEGVVERQAIYAIAACNIASLLLGLVGLVLGRAKRADGLHWLRLSILVNLLFGQVFNFTDSQFNAIAGLPNTLIAFAFVTYELRHQSR